MRNEQRKSNRDLKIKRRFTELYEVKRQRIDDCLEVLADEFDLQPDTVRRIIADKQKKKSDKPRLPETKENRS